MSLPSGHLSEPTARPQLVAKLLGVAGSSQFENEAVNAIRTIDRMQRAAGMRWPDLTDGHRRAEIATEGAAVALAEANELRAELSHGTPVAVWQDVGAKITSTGAAAEWALDLNRQGLVWLSPKEIDFLGSVTRWVGTLRPRQQPFLQSVLDCIVERTGLVPPND